MLGALRFVRLQPHPLLRSAPASSSPSVHRRTAGLCTMAQQAKPENRDKMEEKKNPAGSNGDTMSHSFGEGYATRSDEEGFGGTHGGNQSLPAADDDETVDRNHPSHHGFRDFGFVHHITALF